MGLCASSNVKKNADGSNGGGGGDGGGGVADTKVANPLSSSSTADRPGSSRSIQSLPSSEAGASPSPRHGHGRSNSSAEQKVKELLKRRARKKVVVNVTDSDELDDNAAAELAKSIAAKTKTDEDSKWIRATLADKFFLFNDLEADMQNALIMCFEKKEYAQGGKGGLAAAVIEQGDAGDYMYIIEKGTFAVDVDGNKVATLGPGALFGELALLYDAARAASVVAMSDAVVWRVGRREFKFAVRLAAKKSRATISDTLGKVDILKNLGTEQIAAIASVLEVSSLLLSLSLSVVCLRGGRTNA